MRRRTEEGDDDNDDDHDEEGQREVEEEEVWQQEVEADLEFFLNWFSWSEGQEAVEEWLGRGQGGRAGRGAEACQPNGWWPEALR